MRRARAARQLAVLLLLLLVVLAYAGPAAGREPVPTSTAYAADNPTTGGVRLGASLGLTGQYAEAAREAQRGLQLLQEVLAKANRTLDVDVKDDRSSVEACQQLYKDMASSGSYAALIGPASPEQSYAAALAAKEAGMALMLHQDPMPSTYQQGFRYVFSVNVLAPNYFGDSLSKLYDAGARSLVLVRGTEDLQQAQCEGAASSAGDTGYALLGDLALSALGPLETLRQVAALDADVLLGCVGFADAVHITTAARTLLFSPRALLLAESATVRFQAALGPALASYIVAPVAWHPSQAGGVVTARTVAWATPAEFASAYRQKFKAEPSEAAAQAAAAGLAMYLAARARPEDIRAALLDDASLSSQETFFGTLNFTANGTRGARALTQQLVPRAVPVNASGRRVSLEAVLLDEAAKLHYPRPSWHEIAAEVYPCQPGFARNGSSAACTPCPRGTSRPSSSVVCQECQAGSYADAEGLAECSPCPAGLRCTALAHGRAEAAAGWWLPPAASAQGVRQAFMCEPPEACLGGNLCASGRTGSLCGNCLPGYKKNPNTYANVDDCVQCNPGVEAAWCVLLVMVYLIFAWALWSAHHASAPCLLALHCPLLRIFFNYAVAAAAVLAGGFNQAARPVRALVGLFLDAPRVWLSLECVYGSPAMPLYQLLILTGLVLLPAVLVANVAGVLVCRLFQAILALTSDDGRDEAGAQQSMSIKVTNDEEEDEDKKEDSSEDEGRVQIGLEIVHEDSDRADTRTSFFEISTMARTSVIWIFLLYPIVVRLLLQGVTCMDKDALRLVTDPDVVCFQGEHRTWAAAAGAGLLVYGLALPAALAFHLRSARHSTFEVAARRQGGFLWNGFKGHCFYSEILFMLRKLLILLVAIEPNRLTRMWSLLWVLGSCLAAHVYLKPFDDREFFVLHRLETLALVALIVPTLASLFFCMRDSMSEAAATRFLSYPSVELLIGAACYLSHVAFWALLTWSLTRNLIMKKLTFLQENLPSRLGRRARLCLRLARGRAPGLAALDPATAEVDTSKLSERERYFLCRALCDTLRIYIEADEQLEECRDASFYPGFLTTALYEAFLRVERSRKRRVEHILRKAARPPCCAGAFGAEAQAQMSRSTSPACSPRKYTGVKVATVEELHLALMVSWPCIQQRRRSRYFKMPETQAEQAPRMLDDVSPTSSCGEQSKSPRSPEKQSETSARSLNALHRAACAESLRGEHSELSQRVAELRQEVILLQRRLHGASATEGQGGTSEIGETKVPEDGESDCSSRSSRHRGGGGGGLGPASSQPQAPLVPRLVVGPALGQQSEGTPPSVSPPSEQQEWDSESTPPVVATPLVSPRRRRGGRVRIAEAPAEEEGSSLTAPAAATAAAAFEPPLAPPPRRSGRRPTGRVRLGDVPREEDEREDEEQSSAPEPATGGHAAAPPSGRTASGSPPPEQAQDQELAGREAAAAGSASPRRPSRGRAGRVRIDDGPPEDCEPKEESAEQRPAAAAAAAPEVEERRPAAAAEEQQPTTTPEAPLLPPRRQNRRPTGWAKVDRLPPEEEDSDREEPEPMLKVLEAWLAKAVDLPQAAARRHPGPGQSWAGPPQQGSAGGQAATAAPALPSTAAPAPAPAPSLGRAVPPPAAGDHAPAADADAHQTTALCLLPATTLSVASPSLALPPPPPSLGLALPPSATVAADAGGGAGPECLLPATTLQPVAVLGGPWAEAAALQPVDPATGPWGQFAIRNGPPIWT